MQAFPRRVLGFVAVAVLVNSVYACSDIKIFLAPCTVKQFGTSISKDQALDIQSEFLRKEGLDAIADEAVEFFDFGLEAFDGTCEFPISDACDVVQGCGCDIEQIRLEIQGGGPRGKSRPMARRSKTDQSFRDGGSTRCYPYLKPGRCFSTMIAPEVQLIDPIQGVSGPVSVQQSISEPATLSGETIVVLCFGSQCKGFSILSDDFIRDRRNLCGESLNTIGSCSAAPLPPPPPPPPPTTTDGTLAECEDEILARCCNSRRPTCICKTCSSRFWRRTQTSSGQTAFFERQSQDTCICLG
ncbi:hypothetical protein BSKO_12613 [Bryopsis sp. KO-2023]|nr:hypothetical protein BSKO_12613 [Bryopsis sp. KO-2023]